MENRMIMICIAVNFNCARIVELTFKHELQRSEIT